MLIFHLFFSTGAYLHAHPREGHECVSVHLSFFCCVPRAVRLFGFGYRARRERPARALAMRAKCVCIGLKCWSNKQTVEMRRQRQSEKNMRIIHTIYYTTPYIVDQHNRRSLCAVSAQKRWFRASFANASCDNSAMEFYALVRTDEPTIKKERRLSAAGVRIHSFHSFRRAGRTPLC